MSAGLGMPGSMGSTMTMGQSGTMGSYASFSPENPSKVGEGLIGSESLLQTVQEPIAPPDQDVARFREAMSNAAARFQPTERPASAPQADFRVQQTAEPSRLNGGDRILQSLDRMRVQKAEVKTSPLQEFSRIAQDAMRVASKPNVFAGDLLKVQAQLMQLGLKVSAATHAQKTTTDDLKNVLQAQ